MNIRRVLLCGVVAMAAWDTVGIVQYVLAAHALATMPPSAELRASLQEAPIYSIHDLNLAPSPTGSVYHGGAINGHGVVAATIQDATAGNRPVLVQNDQVTPLTIPTGYAGGTVLGLNDAGTAAGYAQNSDTDTQAVLWSTAPRPTLLPRLPGEQVSIGNAINAAGDVAGYCYSTGKSAAWWSKRARATLWRNGKAIDLGLPPNCIESRAYAINNEDVVVGWALTKDNKTHAFMWDRGRMTDLRTLPGGHVSAATGVNNKGQIAGDSDTATGELHAVIWENGHIRDIGTPPNSTWCKPVSINDSGTILLDSQINTKITWPPQVFTWSPSQGFKGIGLASGHTEQLLRAIAIGNDGTVIVGGSSKEITELYDHHLFALKRS